MEAVSPRGLQPLQVMNEDNQSWKETKREHTSLAPTVDEQRQVLARESPGTTSRCSRFDTVLSRICL